MEIYTDGSCKGNPGAGGWGFAVYDTDHSVLATQWGGTSQTTNNRMELTAILRALEWLFTSTTPATPDVTIVTDSTYCHQGLTRWLPGWRANNWRRADGRTNVLNCDLWRALDDGMRRAAEAGYNVRTRWVRGHSTCAGNNHADMLSNMFHKSSSDSSSAASGTS